MAGRSTGMHTDAPPTDVRIVVVGASAGGLEALTDFLGAVEPGSGAAFVIAQHLAPTHPTLLVDLLAPATRLRARLAEDGAPFEPDTFSVVPPDRDATVTRSGLRLVQPPERSSPRPSIDRLFTSAAETWGDAVTAVVLSGTGADGAEGLRAVRAAGGLTMVQRPGSARFSGMPQAALSLGIADVVADARELGERVSFLDPRRVVSGLPESAPGTEADIEMLRIATTQMRRTLGMDFTGYKASTLSRQIHRRMAITGSASFDDYFAILAQDRLEAQHLADSLLVKVTSFFRDDEAFEALRLAVVDMIASRQTEEPFRVWVPGCATGEEAYSIGMLVSAALGHPSDLSQHLKIFGTDMDEASLTIARRGHYPASLADRIPLDLRRRFTVDQGDGCDIVETLRACTVFARHDVTEDPPFPRMDLVSCRNTLIYFTPAVQHRVITFLGYSLRPGGLLFLGKAENLDPATPGFTPIDAQWRVFRRTEEDVERPTYSATGIAGRYSRAVGSTQHVPVIAPVAPESSDDLLDALVRSSGEVFMVVDEDLDLVEVVGDVTPFCRIPEGRVTSSVLALLRPELQDEARALLLLSRAQNTVVIGRTEGLDDADVSVRLRVRPLQVGTRSLQVLSFDPAEVGRGDEAPVRDEAGDELIRQLERQLLDSQRELRRSLAELQASNEELEASSEELQASSEELQAANEELESSNEELQATNEELGSLNQELRLRATQLQRVNEVLENIQGSLDQGMVIVDISGAVERYSASAVRLFSLMESDIGRRLVEVPSSIPVPDLGTAIAEVLQGGPRQRIEVSGDERSFLVQVLPYRDDRGAIEGAIITLTDIADMVSLRTALESTIEELRERELRLEEQATYDSLTGLLNRGAFTDAVVREMARARRSEGPLALIWADIDRFKEINDGHGHEAGDAALREAASRISSTVRDADFVGRLGGDEFGVAVVEYRNAVELDAIVERLVVALREPLDYEGQAIRLSGSLGVALFATDAENAEDLLRAADAAMYSAKRAGGDGHMYFDGSMNAAADERRLLRERLDRAVQHHEFVLHYQPIVTLPGREPWGYEALLRWDRDGECVSAGEFVPFAEETGQIRALGMETLRLLRDDIAHLHQAGFGDHTVSVNMSVMQLEDRLLSELLDHWPTPGGLQGVTVEILESAFLPDRLHALRTVQQLAGLGARIAVDDYGSGYSNLTLLRSLSPDFIKLDRSFLAMSDDVAVREALLSSAIVLSGVVGAKVIAEGVETEEDVRLLTSLGASMAQGFHIAEPMPVDDLMTWLAARRGG